jgi:hypothetical protein
MLGEKFRSDDTIHTIIRKISSKTKLYAKLHLFHDRTIHVRGGIYRALAFVFYIKWLFYPWPNYLQPFIYERAKWSFLPNSVFFFAFNLLFLQWICFLQIILCFLSTSLSSKVEFLTTKSIGEVEFLMTKLIGEVEFLTTKSICEVEFLTTKSIGEVEFLATKSICEVEFLATKSKYILRCIFSFKWISS